jgi:hypothetical protein
MLRLVSEQFAGNQNARGEIIFLSLQYRTFPNVT